MRVVDCFRPGDIASYASNSFSLTTTFNTLQSITLEAGTYLVLATVHVNENDDLLNLMLIVDGVAQIDQAEIDNNKTACTLTGPLVLTSSDVVLLRGARTGTKGTVQARLMVMRLNEFHNVS
jgi:hypothetical protein